MTYRLLLVAYLGLGGLLSAAGRPWLAVPLCLISLLAIGGLWMRALPGVPTEAPIPALRSGLTALAGLVTLPLAALSLHAAGAPVRPIPLVIACAVTATLLGVGALIRERRVARRLSGDAARQGDSGSLPTVRILNPEPGYGRTSRPFGSARTTAAVAIPVALAVSVGAGAVIDYLNTPGPAEPGYLSVALNGWAAAIDRPVTVGARGLVVPVRVTSSGLGDVTRLLQLRVGGRVVASRPMTVAAGTVRSLSIYVPALPPDGCLRAVNISVGTTSTGFYARGVTTRPSAAGAALTAPGGQRAAARELTAC